jgi:hypothetical protein
LNQEKFTRSIIDNINNMVNGSRRNGLASDLVMKELLSALPELVARGVSSGLAESSNDSPEIASAPPVNDIQVPEVLVEAHQTHDQFNPGSGIMKRPLMAHSLAGPFPSVSRHVDDEGGEEEVTVAGDWVPEFEVVPTFMLPTWQDGGMEEASNGINDPSFVSTYGVDLGDFGDITYDESGV